jgi:hypothetical protein
MALLIFKCDLNSLLISSHLMRPPQKYLVRILICHSK